MSISSTSNRLGALALAIADAEDEAMRMASGLGQSACSVLVTLGPYPNTAIGELARIAGLSHSVMVRTVEKLEAAGLVERRPSEDRRRVALALSAEGERRRIAILAARHGVLEMALHALAPDERQVFERALARMLEALTTSRGQADHLCRLCDEDACGADCPVELRACRLEGEV